MVIGALLYVKDVERISAFYQAVLGLPVRFSDERHQILGATDPALTIHAIPSDLAAEIEIRVPPVIREDQSIKILFSVASLAEAGAHARRLGGGMFDSAWSGQGFTARDGFDPEGNVFHLREPA